MTSISLDVLKFLKTQPKNIQVSSFKPLKLPVVFDMIAEKVLPDNQRKLKVFLEKYSQSHFLGGGTAIALRLGHRKSIDFDFFNDVPQVPLIDVLTHMDSEGFKLDESEINTALRYVHPTDRLDKLNFSIDGVKISLINFYRYSFEGQKIDFIPSETICGGIRTAKLEDLATMKLFAMATRNKWKDAVDLFFIIKEEGKNLEELLALGEKNFKNMFFTDLILERLLDGIWDKSEPIEYLIENPPEDSEIVEFLKTEAKKIIKKRLS